MIMKPLFNPRTFKSLEERKKKKIFSFFYCPEMIVPEVFPVTGSVKTAKVDSKVKVSEYILPFLFFSCKFKIIFRYG